MGSKPSGGGDPGADWRRAMTQAAPYLSLGLQLGVAMVVFVGAGYLLDQWLGTLPWLTIVGAVFGLIGVIAQIVRVSSTLDGQRKSGGQRRR